MRLGADIDLQRELIAADQTTRRMDDIDVADRSFRIEGALDQQRPAMQPMRQARPRLLELKPQFEPRLPARPRRLRRQRVHTVRCVRTSSSVSALILPDTTSRPLSRMRKSLATRRAN